MIRLSGASMRSAPLEAMERERWNRAEARVDPARNGLEARPNRSLARRVAGRP